MSIKALLGSAVLCLMIGTSGASPQQDTKKKKSNDCPMPKVESGWYCPVCSKILEKDDLDKEKRCKACFGKMGKDYKDRPKQVDVCVRKFYHAKCHPDKYSEKPFACCGNTYDQQETDKAKIGWVCDSCGCKADTQQQLTHPKSCPNKSRKYCTKTGEKPHVKDYGS